MTIQTLNPAGLLAPQGYVHVAMGGPGQVVSVAGQTAINAEGVFGETGLAGQTALAIQNVAIALDAANATLADVVSSTILVVDLTPEKMEELVDGAMQAASAGNVLVTAATLIPVSSLAIEGAVVEIAVTAVI